MHKHPLVSVIIPTYNRHEVLRQLLNQLIAEPPENAQVELIVVDDQSRDGTWKMLEGEFPTVHRILGPGKSAKLAKRAGVEVSKGDIVVFLDDDVFCHQGWIDKVLPAFEGGETLVQAKLVFKDLGQQNESKETRAGLRTGFRWDMMPVAIVNGARRNQYIHICHEFGLFISRSVLHAIPFDDPSLMGDYGEAASFYLRASARGHKVWLQADSVIDHLGALAGGGKEREAKVPPSIRCSPYVIPMVHNFLLFARVVHPMRLPLLVLYYVLVGVFLSIRQRKFCVHYFLTGIVKGLKAPFRQPASYSNFAEAS